MNATQSARVTATYYSHPEVDPILQRVFPEPSQRQSVQVVLRHIVQKEHLRTMRRHGDDYVHPRSAVEYCWTNHEFYAHTLTRNSYKAMMDLLVYHRVLQSSFFTSPKGFHPTYRMAKREWLNNYKLPPVTIPRVLKKIATYKQYRLERYPTVEQLVIPHIIKNFCYVDLVRSEFERLWEYRYKNRYLKFPREHYLTPEQYREHGSVVWQSIEAWNATSDEQKEQWFTVCSFGHRLHHPFTYWPKEIRAYILDATGSPLSLVEFDLSNSQLFIFADTLVRLDASLREEEFVKLVEAHAIYEDVARRLGMERDPAKTVMLHWLYSMGSSKAQKEFESHYGRIAVMAGKIKEREFDEAGNRMKLRSRHKKLPMMMQRAESAMFRDIWVEVIKQGHVMLPVHDALYVAKASNIKENNPIVEIMTGNIKNHTKLLFNIKAEEVSRNLIK